MSVATDFTRSFGVLGSAGLSAGWPQPPTGGLAVTALFFPTATADDLLALGSLSAEWSVDSELAGPVLNKLLSLAGRPPVAWSVPLDLTVSFDPDLLLGHSTPVGLGVSLNLIERKLGRSAPGAPTGTPGDMKSPGGVEFERVRAHSSESIRSSATSASTTSTASTSSMSSLKSNVSYGSAKSTDSKRSSESMTSIRSNASYDLTGVASTRPDPRDAPLPLFYRILQAMSFSYDWTGKLWGR